MLVVALWRLATDATQAAGGDETVLKLRSVTERKQSKMGGDDEADVQATLSRNDRIGSWTDLASIASPAFAQGNPLRDAYFGETHVHTSWSLDAWMMGNRITDPGDAYKYFKGETIKHPLGYDIKIETPLDFAGVTDHSEYVGVMKLANEPEFADQQESGRGATCHEEQQS